MKSIKLQNIRSLKDTGFIELKPLTIIVGENSSGKSTFARMFPLFKQSILENPQGPILFNGELIDFGDLNNIKTKDGLNENLILSFKYDAKPAIVRPLLKGSDIVEVEVSFTIKDKENGVPYVSFIEIKFHEYDISFNFEKKDSIKVFSGENDFSKNFQNVISIDDGRLFPVMFEKTEGLLGSEGYRYRRLGEIDKFSMRLSLPRSLVSEVKLLTRSYHKSNASEDRVNNSITEISRLVYLNKPLKENLMKLRSATSYWTKKLEKYNNEKKIRDDFNKIENILAIHNSLNLLDTFNSLFVNTARNVRYIAPLRATAERYYRSRNISVGAVDSRGENLPMFIASISPSDLRNLREWLLNNFHIDLEVISEGGHISLHIRHEGSENIFNITDTGFGFSQVIPILIQLWSLIFQKKRSNTDIEFPIIYVIEQPELHLHPRMQSIIADIFCKAIVEAISKKIDLRIIMETHSESIINKVGKIINNGNFENDNTNIVIFEKTNKDSYSKIKISKFKENGQLENWPWGFFD